MSREFDILIFGATGFTGSLIAEYLANTYSKRINIALAGRSQNKLDALRDELGISAPAIIGNANDLGAMQAMASRAKVVVSCTGPFLLYGSNMVQACAENGTDYVDVTGEVYWSSKMIAAHNETARQSGARIISLCGFDSVPSDLGVYLVQKGIMEKRGKPARHVKGRVKSLRGYGLGTSQATFEARMKLAKTTPDIVSFADDAYGLCSGFEGPQQPTGSEPQFDEELNSWAAPFLMHRINSKVVHRTNFLLGAHYGEDFIYDEMSSTGPGEEGKAKIPHSIQTLGGFDWNGEESKKNLKPGEGPDKKARDAGFYSISYYGVENGEILGEVKIADDCDPGCASTSKLVGESAMCLLEDGVATEGGFWTPASGMGEALYERLFAKKVVAISEHF